MVLPTTLQEWQEAVLKHHGRWLKTKAALGDYSPFRHPQSQMERWAAALGRPQRRTNQVVPIDVDPIRTTPLTEEMKKKPEQKGT